MNIAKRNKMLFENADVDAILLNTSSSMPDSNLRYFTCLGQHFLSSNVLILKPGRKPLLLKSLLEPKVYVPGLRSLNIDRKSKFEKVLKEQLKHVKTIGLNKPLYTSSSFRNLKKITGKKKLVDVSKKLALIRAIKSDEEIARISKACNIAENVAAKIPSLFRKGITEKKLGMDIEVLLREKGDNILPFPVIVASDKNSSFPHSVLSDKRISKGLLLFDFGAYYKNYSSDITRVFSVGRATKRQKQLYKAVFDAKQYAQTLIKPGAVAGTVFEKTDSFLKKHTKMKLIHGLGHGLGVDVHDFPSGFVNGNKERLKENMAFTVEPGIYGNFGGIRIEDDVVVTAKGCKQLTKAPSELIEL